MSNLIKYVIILFLSCLFVYYLFDLLVEILKNMKPKKNKSDPTEFLKFDNLILMINNEYHKLGKELNWKEEVLELLSVNLGEKDEIYIKVCALEIQDLDDIVKLKKLIEEARDKHLKNEIRMSSEKNKTVSGETKDKNSNNDGKNILEKDISSIWSEYQGKMNWYEANTKAKELGMRLPKLGELEKAYDHEVTESWKVDGIEYWTSKEIPIERAYYFNIDNGNKDTNEIYHYLKLEKYHVRCIRL